MKALNNTDLYKKYSIDAQNIPILSQSGIKVADDTKLLLIEKIMEAHELGLKNKIWGNITKKGYATNVGLDNGFWYCATNFNNTRNQVSSICGERSAIVSAYNELLRSMPEVNPENKTLDFKVKYLAMSSKEALGEYKNAANPCAECLSWLNTSRYFQDDTIIASFQKDEKGTLYLNLAYIKDYLPQRNESVEYPNVDIEKIKLNISNLALSSMKNKNINEETIKAQVIKTKEKFDSNKYCDISKQNIAASVYANNKIYCAQKTDFSKRWYIEPLEFAFAKALEDNSENIKIDSICYIGQERKFDNILFCDKIVNIKVLGELSTRFISSDTLIITTKQNSIDIKTVQEYLPNRFKFIQAYDIPKV